MKKVVVFLADGFEEVEGLTVVDLLRRAGAVVETVSVMGKLQIDGAHGIQVEADELFEKAFFDDAELLVLPGGMPGTLHLKEQVWQTYFASSMKRERESQQSVQLRLYLEHLDC